MRQAVDHACHAARKRLVTKLPARKLQRLASAFQRVMSPSDPRSMVALDARLAHRATKVRTAIARAGALYAPQPLHDVRIALKKLRYAAELSLETGRPRSAADVGALKAAQDLLGRLHDCEVLVAWGRDAQASLFPPDVITWRELRSLVHAVEVDCRQMHARYMRDRAGLIAIADRLGAREPLPAAAGHSTAR